MFLQRTHSDSLHLDMRTCTYICSRQSGNPDNLWILRLPRQSEDCVVNLRLLCRIRLLIVQVSWELYQVLSIFVVYIVRYNSFVLGTFFSWDGAQGTSEGNFKVQSLFEGN